MRVRTVGQYLMGIAATCGVAILAVGHLSAQTKKPAATPPIMIQKQGSFAAGGTILGDAATRSLRCDHGYVDYQIPVNPRKVNLVMWHSAAAHAFLNRWDGGEGYQSIFLRRGYPVYIWDGPQIGRANWGCTEHTYKPGIGRDQGTFVAEAQKKVAAQVSLPPGYTLTWGGQFENQQRAAKRLLDPARLLNVVVGEPVGLGG